jgi:hypothetical protein
VVTATPGELLTPYSASFALPASLPVGRYTVATTNDVSRIVVPFDSFLNETTPLWRTIEVRVIPFVLE